MGQVGGESAHGIRPQAHNAQKSLFLLQTYEFSGGSLGMREQKRQGATTTVAKKERVSKSVETQPTVSWNIKKIMFIQKG